MSAPAVSSHERKKIAKNIGEMTFGGGFLLFCCQPQIYIGIIHMNVDEMCFIPINVHDWTVQWCSSAQIWQHHSSV